MQQTMSFIDAIIEKVSRNPVGRMVDRLQSQPLMREYWLAEDAALEETIGSISELERQAKLQAIRIYSVLEKEGRIPSGQEDAYRELSIRNARRDIWDSRADIQEELADLFAAEWRRKMQDLKALDEFNMRYVEADGRSRFNTTIPDEPYFYE